VLFIAEAENAWSYISTPAVPCGEVPNSLKSKINVSTFKNFNSYLTMNSLRNAEPSEEQK
jgi:hypothetical protein